MARIDHPAIYSNDPDRVSLFYETYFDGVRGPARVNPPGILFFFVTFEDGARLEFVRPEYTLEQGKGVLQTGFGHMAIRVGSEQKVNEIVARIEADGGTVLLQPKRFPSGSYEGIVCDPDGNQIEVCP